MRPICNAKMTRTGRLKKLLDYLRHSHATHTCVHPSPIHVGDHICSCNTKWPLIRLPRMFER